MTLADLQDVLRPLIDYFTALLVSGVSVSLVTQLLKQEWVFVPAEKFPRLTSAVLSVLATMAAIVLTDFNYAFNGVLDVLGFAAGTAIVSAVTYLTIIKRKDSTAKL